MKQKGASSIGRCYTAMHNPTGIVCTNQDCEDKFHWVGPRGRYVRLINGIITVLFPCIFWSRVKHTYRWRSIRGAAYPYLYLLVDKEQNVIPAKASDTGCALCLCTGTTGERNMVSKSNLFSLPDTLGVSIVSVEYELCFFHSSLGPLIWHLKIMCSPSSQCATRPKPLPPRRAPA